MACLDRRNSPLVAQIGWWHAVVMSEGELSGPCLEAIQRGFQFARDLGSGCRPVHFLVGISEGDGPAAAALNSGSRLSLRAIVTAATGPAASAGYLHMQAQQAARSFAAARHEPAGAEHLLVALLDQSDAEIAATLALAGLDRAALRRTVLIAIGGTGDEPSLEFPQLTPAGTLDRPALPPEDLDERAWAVLRWRQDHLPLQRVRGPGGAQALAHLERQAAWRLADQMQVDQDQRYSLIHHHVADVERRAGIVRVGPGRRPGASAAALALARARRRSRHRAVRNVTVGWAAWLGNRRVTARDQLFRLRTIRDYRDCPPP
jgi:hypothetical protein